MKIKQLLIAATVATAITSAVTATAADYREHRGVYLTCVMADWPSSPLTASNAQQHKNFLIRKLDRMLANGVNILYFAVRPYCDAAYKSQYEPWSLCISGKRGLEPPFDPLEFVIAESHARGIEVYTLLNAYRYSNTWRQQNENVDYKAEHPDWLLVQDHETILNPCLEEVKQRVCDVAADITEHYDIDGFLFDDYYYSNPTPFDVDAEFYQAALAADPKVGTQLEWRVKNVNDLVERVGKTVKGMKPWVVYGIKPAGVASPPHVRNYGLEPFDGYSEGDWQYKAIAADPLYWYSNHFCDFMAPQIYWCDLFTPLQDWWVIASRKFDRHLFSAVNMEKYSTYGAKEFAREAVYARTTQADNIGGIGYFRWEHFFNSYAKDANNKNIYFDQYMGDNVWTEQVLAPIRHWNNEYEPAYVTNLHRDGNMLLWDAVEGDPRFTIYAFAPGEEQKPFNTNLKQVRYTNSYEIPSELAGYTFGVAVYDRYANEYPMTTEGAASAQAPAQVLTYPADGEAAADLFDFTWQPTGGDNLLEVSDTPDFTNKLIMVTSAADGISSYVVNNLEDGKTYWWRLRTNVPNAPVATSEVRSFTTKRIAVTGPEDNEQTLTPTIEWTPAYNGSTYHVEVSRNNNFTLVDFEADTELTKAEVPAGRLISGHAYYVRVTASRGGHSTTSEVQRFATADVVYDAPRFVNPATAGETLHCNQPVTIDNWSGLSSVSLQISASEGFPTTKTYRTSLTAGETSTVELGNIKVGTKYLVDGETYYVRAAGNYFLQSSSQSTKATDWAVTSFVYSSEAGVSDCSADSDNTVEISPEGILCMSSYGNNVNVFTADGRSVMTVSGAGTEVDLSALPHGLYIVSVSGAQEATIKWAR